jgi:hypothetical protein
VAGIKKPGRISETFDSVSKRAIPRNDDGCAVCEPRRKRQEVEVYRSINAIYRFEFVRIRLFVTWEFNGCDVIGATFILGSSVARFGWEADIVGQNLETTTTKRTTCDDCCARCACVSLKYSIKVSPPLGLPGARGTEGIVVVCGNGLFLDLSE